MQTVAEFSASVSLCGFRVLVVDVDINLICSGTRFGLAAEISK